MALGDEPVNFNRKSADLIGRTIKDMRGRGRGETPLPKRRRGGVDGGPGSGGKRTSLLIATDTIPAAAGGFPGDSSDFSIEDGDDPNGVIYNWSGETIGSGSYMVTIQIGDRDVIVQAFCPMIM